MAFSIVDIFIITPPELSRKQNRQISADSHIT
jgi:hypothetical protein